MFCYGKLYKTICSDFRPKKQDKPKEITKKKQKDIIDIMFLPNSR